MKIWKRSKNQLQNNVLYKAVEECGEQPNVAKCKIVFFFYIHVALFHQDGAGAEAVGAKGASWKPAHILTCLRTKHHVVDAGFNSIKMQPE